MVNDATGSSRLVRLDISAIYLRGISILLDEGFYICTDAESSIFLELECNYNVTMIL